MPSPNTTSAPNCLADLRPATYNPRQISEEAIRALGESLARYGNLAGIVFNLETGNLVGGHQTLEALKRQHGDALEFWPMDVQRGEIRTPNGDIFPVRYVRLSEDDEITANILANSEELRGRWTDDAARLIDRVRAALAPGAFDLLRFDDLANRVRASLASNSPSKALEDDAKAAAFRSLSAEFIVPPFSVLDARQGYWVERKQAWIALGIESGAGRGENLLRMSDNAAIAKKGRKGTGRLTYQIDRKRYDDARQEAGRTSRASRLTFNVEPDGVSPKPRRTLGATPPNLESEIGTSGTSVFDPVLTELLLRWFSPPEGRVFDPFAGGSVRGIVSALLGRRYVGIDLRSEQVEANEVQWAQISTGAESRAAIRAEPITEAVPRWITGDSRDAQTLLAASGENVSPFDFVLSCPPYLDLEVYSDDERDLSNASAAAFEEAYRSIISHAIARLADDSFAAFVVGDVREKRGEGFFRRFPEMTISAFEDAGARLYNRAILLVMLSSLPLRVRRQFTRGRKLGTAHQEVLIFCKGSARKACEKIGPVQFGTSPVDEDGGE